MFSMDLSAKIRSATATRRTSSDDTVNDSTSVCLAFDYTPEVAGHLGERGIMLHQALSDGGLKSATIDLQAVAVVVDFLPGDLHLNKETRAVALALKSPSKEGATPVATLTLRLPTMQEHLMWFVERLEEIVQVRIEVQQGELAL